MKWQKFDINVIWGRRTLIEYHICCFIKHLFDNRLYRAAANAHETSILFLPFHICFFTKLLVRYFFWPMAYLCPYTWKQPHHLSGLRWRTLHSDGTPHFNFDWPCLFNPAKCHGKINFLYTWILWNSHILHADFYFICHPAPHPQVYYSPQTFHPACLP